jgi:hypothetical protein
VFGLVFLGLVVVSSALTASWLRPMQEIDWQSSLLIVLLLALSPFIGHAYRVAQAFSEAAKLALKGDEPPSPIADHLQLMQSRKALLWFLPFILFGVVAGLLSSDDLGTRLFRSALIGTTLYYASFGLWGAIVVSSAISVTAQRTLTGKTLNVFHPDRHAGLGFCLKYANHATVLLFLGLFALPMGVTLANSGYARGDIGGIALAVSAIAAILAWTACTIIVGFRGRMAIHTAITRYLGDILTDLAQRKLALFEQRGSRQDYDMLVMKEEAANKLSRPFLIGVGAWKDAFSVGPAAFAIKQTDMGFDALLWAYDTFGVPTSFPSP